MDVEVKVDGTLDAVRVVIYAPAQTPEVVALVGRILAEAPTLLVGYQDGVATPLPPEDILRFYGERKEVCAQTAAGRYTVRRRLYELEDCLDRRFVRISNSEIVNLRKVTALDLHLSGTIRMTLTGGVVTYVSRRYVKGIKEVLGI